MQLLFVIGDRDGSVSPRDPLGVEASVEGGIEQMGGRAVGKLRDGGGMARYGGFVVGSRANAADTSKPLVGESVTKAHRLARVTQEEFSLVLVNTMIRLPNIIFAGGAVGKAPRESRSGVNVLEDDRHNLLMGSV